MLTCIQHTCIRAYMQTCVHVRACIYGYTHTSARFKVLWQRIEPNPFSGRKHLSFIIRPDVKLPFLCEGAQQVRWRHRHDGWKAANDVHNLHWSLSSHTWLSKTFLLLFWGMKILQKVGRFPLSLVDDYTVESSCKSATVSCPSALAAGGACDWISIWMFLSTRHKEAGSFLADLKAELHLR